MALSEERQVLLKKKGDEYISGMEEPGKGINYIKVSTDRLLILEAVNDWSGRALAEGSDIKFNYGCDDPCCATEFELGELVHRMHAVPPVVLYPVSGFGLSDKDELRFGFQASSFRMLPHISDSRADGIGIAEAKHIKDVEAAMQLWAFCATEDCLAYLDLQLDTHGLYLENEERVATRQIVTSALINKFSIGQIWNAMWRASRDAAALSTRQYYNNAKAAKTIPKKIDKILTQYGADARSFDPYDRLASCPMGSVLTLMLSRFGINDYTPGPTVRAKFVADAGLAEPEEEEQDEYDEGRCLIRGAFFYIKEFTELDRMILSCFKDLKLDTPNPAWDEQYKVMGQLGYTLFNIYAFNGSAFGDKLLTMMNLAPPSEEAIGRHAAAAAIEKAKTKRWVDETGWSQAFEEILVNGGLPPILAAEIRRVTSYPADMEDIVRISRNLPLPSGLAAIRMEHAHVYSTFIEQSNLLSVGDFTISIPQETLEPEGDDQDLVAIIATENYEGAGNLIGMGFINSISCDDLVKRSKLLRAIAHKLNQEADELCPPHEG